MTRTGFVTCVQLGLGCIHEIEAVGGTLHAVFTLPDDVAVKKSGRVFVDEYCRSRGIPCMKIRNINDEEALAQLRALTLDWLFIIGWSQIAGASVLSSVRQGVIGMHPTLLPEGRGRAAVPWAILRGLSVTGVTMFKLDEGVDSGPVLAQERIDIEPRENATTLYGKVETAHRVLMRRTWWSLMQSELDAVPQDSAKATYWPGRRPDEGRISRDMSVDEADRLVRAVTRPYPGAFIDQGDSRWKIWSAVPGYLAAPGEIGERLRLSDGDLIVLEGERAPVPAN